MKTEKLKLLVADSNVKVESLILEIVHDLGTITIVGHGENELEAKTIFDVMKPDIILMELDLSDENGIELLIYYKLRNVNCKVIIFTENKNQLDLNLALQSGADYFITKGKDDNRLKCILSEISGNRFYTRDHKNTG